MEPRRDLDERPEQMPGRSEPGTKLSRSLGWISAQANGDECGTAAEERHVVRSGHFLRIETDVGRELGRDSLLPAVPDPGQGTGRTVTPLVAAHRLTRAFSFGPSAARFDDVQCPFRPDRQAAGVVEPHSSRRLSSGGQPAPQTVPTLPKFPRIVRPADTRAIRTIRSLRD